MVSVLMAHPALNKYAPHMQIALAVVGGSNVSDALAARTKTQLHVRAVTVGYGLTGEACRWERLWRALTLSSPTEGAPITSWDVQRPEISKGIGTVMAESAVMIVDADTLEVLPRNEPGELLITGSLTIQRYGNGASQETFVALPDMHGKTRTWMRTGDFASMDDDGVIHLQGRIKDIIIRGGENLSAARIEGAIEEMGGVKVAQVVGTAHTTYGELPVAIVEYNPDCKEEERTIYRHVSQRLGPDSAPVRTFELSDLGLDAWPMTLSRKVQKRFLLTAVDAYFAAKHERTMEVQPGESTLDTVRRVWQNIVPMAASVHDDDGELAMLINSLDYMAFIGHIRRLLGKTVTMHGLQTHPSMVMQAALVDAAPQIMALGASEGSFRAQPGVDLEAAQIIHLLPPTKFTLEHTRTLVAASLKHVDAGLTWADVESVVPMNSMARYLQTSRRPRSACHRQELHVKRPVAALHRALLLAIDSCEMMRCASAHLDDKWSVLIALRSNAKTQPLLVQSASIATYSDIEQLQIDDNQDGVQPPGLHARFTVVEVQDEPGHAALLSWAQHSIFDFQSLRSFYTTLDRFLAAPETPLPSPVPSLGPFASWLYGREDSGAGAADVAYHVARLAGLSTVKNRWPPQRSPEWMRGCDNGWIDVATGQPGTGRVSLGGDTSKIEAGVVSKAMAVKLEHLYRFRAAHPTIFPAMMVKAALAAFNMAESGSGDVVFAQVSFCIQKDRMSMTLC